MTNQLNWRSSVDWYAHLLASPIVLIILASNTSGEVGRLAQSVGYYVWLRAGRPGDPGSILGKGERIYPLASVSRPALGSTQPTVQWVPGVLSPGAKRGQGMTLSTHPI
jgi:hypothetical protein